VGTQGKKDANPASSKKCVHMLDMTSAYAAVNIAGPRAGDVLSKLTDLDLHPEILTNLACTQGQMAEIYALIVRWDLDALPSYDIYFGREYGQYMWEVLLEAGEEYGVVPVGMEAHQRLVSGGVA
jgi:sarcosine oxidase subunit alpha